MSNERNISFNLLDTIAEQVETFQNQEDESVKEEAYKRIAVCITILLMLSDEGEVVDGVNKIFPVAKRLANVFPKDMLDD